MIPRPVALRPKSACLPCRTWQAVGHETHDHGATSADNARAQAATPTPRATPAGEEHRQLDHHGAPLRHRLTTPTAALCGSAPCAPRQRCSNSKCSGLLCTTSGCRRCARPRPAARPRQPIQRRTQPQPRPPQASGSPALPPAAACSQPSSRRGRRRRLPPASRPVSRCAWSRCGLLVALLPGCALLGRCKCQPRIKATVCAGRDRDDPATSRGVTVTTDCHHVTRCVTRDNRVYPFRRKGARARERVTLLLSRFCCFVSRFAAVTVTLRVVTPRPFSIRTRPCDLDEAGRLGPRGRGSTLLPPAVGILQVSAGFVEDRAQFLLGHAVVDHRQQLRIAPAAAL